MVIGVATVIPREVRRAICTLVAEAGTAGIEPVVRPFRHGLTVGRCSRARNGLPLRYAGTSVERPGNGGARPQARWYGLSENGTYSRGGLPLDAHDLSRDSRASGNGDRRVPDRPAGVRAAAVQRAVPSQEVLPGWD